jgi:hypothetical protein
MTLRHLIVVLAVLPALSLPARAGQLDRRPAVQTIFTGGASCPLTAHDSKESLFARCFLEAKINLLNNAAAVMEKSFHAQAPGLTRQDFRAVAAGILTPEIDGKEFVDTGERTVATIKLRAAVDPDRLAAKIKELAANPELRQKLVAAQEEADAKDKQALSQSGSETADTSDQADYADFSKAADERRKIMGTMQATAASASANIRHGMGDEAVRRILGEPVAVKLGTVTGNFICLGYGEVWVVLENGLVSCLRARLEYSKVYESDCHCAGMLSSFIPFATDAQSGPAPRKGAQRAGQNGQKP